MIKPHGSNELNPLYVNDAQLLADAESLPSVTLTSAAAANAVMLGSGYFNPLTGYMDLADALSTSTELKTRAGVFFPVPVVNRVESTDGIEVGQSLALRDPNMPSAPVLAVMTVEGIDEASDEQIATMTQEVYGTSDADHPGVAAWIAQGKYFLSGPVKVFNFSYFEKDFPDTFRTAYQIREDIAANNWTKVVAFQTRNPMHRAHEELCRMAMDAVGADGCVVHMLLGKLKKGDIPADVRDAAIRTMADAYFPENSVMVTGYGFDMLYAGPREAVLHALFRQNMGATHFIIGRDHAGVGDYYGAFDAQTIFDERVPAGSLEIEVFNADHTAYSKKLNKVVMMRDVPDHTKEDFVLLSGTKVREMLGQGIAPPPEFSRPEVAKILMDYYQSLEAS